MCDSIFYYIGKKEKLQVKKRDFWYFLADVDCAGEGEIIGIM